jgi:hypothetical protein
MVRHDHRGIDLSEEFLREGRRSQLEIVFSETGKDRNEGVVI